MSDDVERIKERLDIADVISGYVDLKPAGKYLKAKSPFTNENTPSFYVSPDKGLYHCFSSGKGGDIFTFIQEMEGVDFYGALKMLAERAGIELTGGSGRKKRQEKKNKLYEILEAATSFYERQLSGNEKAKQYLADRGVTEKTQKRFRLGFAPDDWQAVLAHLRERGFSDADIEEAGLVKQSSKDSSRRYDRFRNRLMFVIEDAAGRPIAFSGRDLSGEDETPKYINSPETPLFVKSKALFGYSSGKQAMRKAGFAIVVEGQFDLVLSHQAGYPNTVATSGTSLTEEHLKLINRLTDNVVFAYDADEAGIASSLKASRKAFSLKMNPKVVYLEDDQDPADVISKEGAERYKEIIREAQPVIEATVARIQGEHGSGSKKTLSRIKDDVLPLVASIADPLERDYYISKLRSKLEISERALREAIHEIESSEVSRHTRQPTSRASNSSGSPQPANDSASTSRQGMVLTLLAGIRHALDEHDGQPEVSEEEGKEMDAQEVVEAGNQAQKNTVTLEEFDEELVAIQSRLKEFDISVTLPDVDRQSAFEAEIMFSQTEELGEVVEELFLHLEERVLVKAYEAKMRSLDGVNDKEQEQELLRQCSQLSRRIHEIRDTLQGTSLEESLFEHH